MNDDLERRLRAHYQCKAADLQFPSREWDEQAAPSDVRPMFAARRDRSRLLVAASVGALVVGGAVGGVALLGDRGAAPTASVGSTIPTIDPRVSETIPSDGPAWTCTPVPDDFDSLRIPNDVRMNTLLPVAPEGFCAQDHVVTTTERSISWPQRYQVWTSCVDCETLTAAVAVIDVGTPEDGFEYDNDDETAVGEEIDVGGERATYFVSGDHPVDRLYVSGRLFTGWGLTRDELAAFAEQALEAAAAAMPEPRSPDEPLTSVADTIPDPPTIDGLVVAFDGTLDSYFPGSVPFTRTLGIWYSRAGDEYDSLGFQVLDAIDQPPLEAYAWLSPGASFVDRDGSRMLVLPEAPSFEGTKQTNVIVASDDQRTVLLSSRSATPITTDELLAIELTPAGFDDPRWEAIAWESGRYDALG